MITTLAKVLVVGPAGVGKTSLLYLLLCKDPPDQRTSTSCAERSIRVIRIGKESGEWNEIPKKEFEQMIAEAVPVMCEELKAKRTGSTEERTRSSTEERMTTISKVVRKFTELVSGKRLSSGITDVTEEMEASKRNQNEEKVDGDEKEDTVLKEEEVKEECEIEEKRREEGRGGDYPEKTPTTNPDSTEESDVAIGGVMQKLTGLCEYW